MKTLLLLILFLLVSACKDSGNHPSGQSSPIESGKNPQEVIPDEIIPAPGDEFIGSGSGSGSGEEIVDGPPVAEESTPKVIFSELLINPARWDYGNEWIELYNPSLEEVDLSNFSVTDCKRLAITIPEGTFIPAMGYLVLGGIRVNEADIQFYQLSLKNSDCRLELKQGEELHDRVDYTGWTIQSGFSLSLDPSAHTAEGNDSEGAWSNTADPTPGMPN